MTAGDPHRAEGRTHQLVGRNGALCAVAHLIAATGPRERQLVLALARTENGLCVGVSPNREIAAWILHSGLTREECVRIQEPGSMVLERSEIQIAGQADVIAAHLERVEAELRENTEASLQVALDRWVEN